MNLGGLESMNEINLLINWMDKITIIFATLAMLGTGYNFLKQREERKRDLQKIPIIFNIEGEKYQLDLDISRKEVTRSEIQGILSNYTTDPSERYKIQYLSEISYLDDIYKIQSATLDKLEIKLSSKEIEGYTEVKNKKPKTYVGFELNKMKKI